MTRGLVRRPHVGCHLMLIHVCTIVTAVRVSMPAGRDAGSKADNIHHKVLPGILKEYVFPMPSSTAGSQPGHRLQVCKRYRNAL